MAPAAIYSERALHRLEIAARLLRRRDVTRDLLQERFAPAVLEVVDRLGAERREHLRALVDWVEAYEREERRRPK